MQNTKVKKYNKGITLVALVITVILLLILAGIGIGAIAGEGGLLSKAQQGAEEYNQAARNEANTINDLLNILNGGEAETPVIDAEGNVQFKYTPSTPTKGSVTVEITTKTEYDIQYRIGDTEGEFEAYTGEITVDENTAIYVKLANNRGNTGGAATGNVQNIDKEAPNAFTMELKATTNSITVSGSTTDVGSVGTALSNIGISGYQFKLDNGNWTAKQASGTYTFNGLTQGTKHTVQMKAVDLAGNERLATTDTGETEGEITTETVIDSTGVIGISYSPTTPTKQNVTVTLTDNSGVEGLTLKYQVGSTTGTWTTYSNPVTMSSNGAIYARLEDNTGQANGYATANVANIDKEQPKAFTMQLTATTNSITVSGSTTDIGSVGTALSNIGISGYQFKLDNGNWTAKQGSGEYTFSGLTQGTKHTVQMKAIDLAGNERLATTDTGETEGEITTEEVVDSTGVIGISYSPTTPTNQNVTVTLTDNSGISGLTLKYQIGSTTGTWTTYSNPVTMSSNGAIYARLEDSTGQANGYATGNVANIDKEAPVILTASSNWGSVTITATDSGSSGTALSNIGIIGYGINQSSTTEPTFTTCPATTSLNQTITGITASGTYYVWVKDRAGNTAKREVTVNVDTTAPEATLEFYYPMVESDNLNPDGFKIKVRGEDEESGVASYKVYIDGSLYTTETTTEETCIINVTGLEEETSYSCYVVVTNGAGQTKQSETIEIKTIASTATIEKIKNYPLGYYGKEVTYAPTNGAPVGWKIFYADSENIYLIADDYILAEYAPEPTNGTTIDKTGNYSEYCIDFETLAESSTAYPVEDERVKKWISGINTFTATNRNMKATAYLLDTEAWIVFKDSEKEESKVEYVIGGPTLELFIASYNNTHETDINYEVTNEIGYKVKWSTNSSYSYYIDGLDTTETLYINDATDDRAWGYWLASPSAIYDRSSLFYVAYRGDVFYSYYFDSNRACRPLVCLKSGIQLVEQESGKYAIN